MKKVNLAILMLVGLLAMKAGAADCCSDIPAAENFNFATAAEYYKRAIPPSGPVSGRWTFVGEALNKKAFPREDDAYDPSGIKNRDGSIASAEFKLNDTFDGAESVNVMYGYDWGRRNANFGPLEVTVNQTGACFSVWPYTNSREEYYAYACKFMSEARDKLICAVTFRALKTTGDAYERYRKWNGKVVFYRGYTLASEGVE